MKPLHIDVAFDFICPWCLIGKRHLSRALELLARSHPEQPVTVHWQGMQLLPDLPAGGLPFAEFYRNRLGSDDAVKARQAQVHAAADQAGLALDLTRIARMPNTANAHRLFAAASQRLDATQQDALLERLFAAYFFNGEDLGDGQTLLHIADGAGLQTDALLDCLDAAQTPYYSDVLANGVPGFAINQTLRFSGAYPPEQLYGAFLQQLEGQPA